MEAAFALARRQALAATGVDEICAAASVSMGAFFHSFKSKDKLATGYHWSAVTEPFFVAAPYLAQDDPLDRALGYIDLRGEMMASEVLEFTCFAGTMAQEASATAPAVQAAVMWRGSSEIVLQPRNRPNASFWRPRDATYSITSRPCPRETVGKRGSSAFG